MQNEECHHYGLDGKQNGFSPHRHMTTKIILVTIRFFHHCRMELKKDEYDKPTFACFSSREGWAKFFYSLEKGNATFFLRTSQ
jgi:hypothetical protein